MTSVQCSKCGQEQAVKPTSKGNPRLPIGWKRVGDNRICSACWQKEYVLRTITIPVASPVDMPWSQFNEIAKRCWEMSTCLANWAITELAKADCVRSPGDTKLAPMPNLYLYPAARARFPEFGSMSTNALLHNITRRYRATRYEVVWQSQAVLPRFRYPVAYPVRQDGWNPRLDEHGVPLVEATFLGTRCTLRLRQGWNYRRQLTAFRKIVAGEAIRSELNLFRIPASGGDHRPAMTDREPGGGVRSRYRLMVRISAWLPRNSGARARSGVLQVGTSRQAFLTAPSDQGREWVVNADHVRRWIGQHRSRLLRLSQDRKPEVLRSKRARLQISDYRLGVVQRYHRRLTTFCHQAAAMLSGYADRLNVAEVHYDARDRSYFSDFPWSNFERLLATKLDEKGILLTVLGKQTGIEDQAA